MNPILLQIQNPAVRPGIGDFTTHSLEILIICAGMFALGWLLHHFIYGVRQRTRIAELEASLNSARTRITDLEGDLEGCNSAIVNIKGENAALNTKLQKFKKAAESANEDLETNRIIATELNFEEENSTLEETLVSGLASDIAGIGTTGYDASGAKTVFGKRILEDDLQIIEGIGPKTAELLNVSSIHTWKQLGSTSVPQLQNILTRAEGRFQLLNPSTWPKQARLAAEGEWVKLREYQDFLVGGVEPPDKTPPVLIGLTDTTYIMGRKIKENDLTVIEGIGPKIQELLHQKQITTWQKLADTEVTRLEEILEDEGERYRMHDPGTWPRQAQMAVEGRWDELKEYQDFLIGGKEPK